MKSVEELNKIREKELNKIALRHEKGENLEKIHVLVCGGTGCHSSQGDEIRRLLHEKVVEKKLENKVEVVLTGCFGLCEAGPNIVIYPEGIFYSHVKLEDVGEIVEEHFSKGNVVKRLLFKDACKGDEVVPVNEVNFYKKQKRVALRNCGLINPEDINEYIAFNGYEALGKILTEMSSKEVIDIIKDSNLRGRGGAGFPAGWKWDEAYNYLADKKYVICNADEGDPGAFMDRSILEGDPHSVLEAMAIIGYAIGSDQGYIYVRAEYPIAVHRLEVAIEQARENGLLGKNIFGTDFDFDIELRLGAGAFVCGEGTALMESIEGRRGMPRVKIHRTAHKGLWGKPTIINNVETLANVPVIFQKGVEWFRNIGTEKSPGTKVFALGGKIKNTGLVEIPMGVTLRDIIFDIGGGIPNNKKFKAVQTGGPSGGCIPSEYLDTPVDFESLGELGSIMGSGGMVVMDEDNCMVDIARFFLDFTVEESCGKCVPCREGTKRMLEILERITNGEGVPEDIDRLESLSQTITDASLCGLGKTAANPVISTLKYFRDEYEAHVYDKKCPSGTCQALSEYYITENCIGCTKCARNCPVSCISGKVKERHVIDTEKCIKCGTCMEACPVGAIVKK
ncbi:NADH-quinone oxidoreductase subunit NuoF [Anaerosalibacter bizertensis]|uniref:NADH-quinone oxidoreductase subunit NuoF n=1 Tax=Anaerosalibacter bizertensis TaxID=932217 RepID=A0A9Q4AB04_9FIRM|nr:NADH-quinone oxidoreductase subunit NuoF [Anaerosalibacter bizertensis]MBV1817768.1 NADH-quinone oxidoreductase subunit NuoF [Bacteroidales bacterium MSK.15.36]MCB5559029.1 NADH-quinone oxidoreductase subunit NuoF [Anaerosalibacter bizertensis]MCG4564311.1 NADH-quinone oxidoreductase subunit NuoF [Anaerosalibacter bizertensis]MCG4581492.1 NADH-quinone oxidoreductase subunit NuoF [Anaerosalibacter bizertensis]